MTKNDSLYAYILSVKSTEAAIWTSSVIKMFFKISQNSREDTCAGVSHLVKLHAERLQLYYKRDSSTDIFM